MSFAIVILDFSLSGSSWFSGLIVICGPCTCDGGLFGADCTSWQEWRQLMSV